MSSIRTVVETFIRLIKIELNTHAVLVASDDIFEVTRVPSVILQGPKLSENSARRTFAKVVDKETATLTYQQARHPLLYNLDFDIIVTAGHEGDLLDLHQKIARFYQHNPSLVISSLGSLPLIEQTPLGGLQRVNLSNLRQSSGRCRIADCPVYEGAIEHGSLIVDRVFEFQDGSKKTESTRLMINKPNRSMTMINVKNLLYQPLTLNLAASKRTLYMRPREIHSINEEEVSKEVIRAQKRGLVHLTYLTKPSKITSKTKPELPKIGKSKSKKGR